MHVFEESLCAFKEREKGRRGLDAAGLACLLDGKGKDFVLFERDAWVIGLHIAPGSCMLQRNKLND